MLLTPELFGYNNRLRYNGRGAQVRAIQHTVPIMSSITVLTLVPNAGDRLPRCLDSVAWADEVFCVVDPKTVDGSQNVARRRATRIEVHEYVNAAQQRNWALPQIQTEWTLVLDADEWVSEELAARIKQLTSNKNACDGYNIRRLSYFFGKRIHYCGWQRDYNLRLFRTPKGRYLDRRVHSKVVVDGTVGRITEPMFHDTYRNFDEYFTTFQRFTTWGAQDLHDKGKQTRIWDLTIRPALRFFKMYILRRGFLDGYHGAVLCGLGAFSVFVKYAKLWRLQRGSGPDEKRGA
ncbi:MAG TPA: glycosyltransferase family 2 protein [Candidatus Bathyarchaeia archaeon]|nr:glycosyltransferase family 2 protein [Candidatus Bathyarchaeia archaeon]